jgi:hypothetical protein
VQSEYEVGICSSEACQEWDHLLIGSGGLLKLADEKNMGTVSTLRPSTLTVEWILGVLEHHSSARK